MAFTRVQGLLGTTEEWASRNPILLPGEEGREKLASGLIAIKIGDGVTPWLDLPYSVNYGNVEDARGTYRPSVWMAQVEAGRFRMGWSNIEGRLWIFPEGTVLYSDRTTPIRSSSDEKPDVLIPEGGGTVRLYSKSWDGALTGVVVGYNADKLGGKLSDLPNITGSIELVSSKISGDLKDIPRVVNKIALSECPNITGNLRDLPPALDSIAIDGYEMEGIVGDVADLPIPSANLHFSNCGVYGAFTQVYGNNVPTVTSLSGTLMTAEDIDKTLIAYSKTTKPKGTVFCLFTNRTANSDDAVAILQGRGWNIIGLTRI